MIPLSRNAGGGDKKVSWFLQGVRCEAAINGVNRIAFGGNGGLKTIWAAFFNLTGDGLIGDCV